jgi:CRP-like cAMP-binding protein
MAFAAAPSVILQALPKKCSLTKIPKVTLMWYLANACRPIDGFNEVENIHDDRPSLHEMTATLLDYRANRLLAAFGPDDIERWLPHFDLVDLSVGCVLCEPNELRTYAYFPTTAVVSMIYLMDTGASAEVAVVGREGFVGVSALLGGGSTLNRAVVQSAGQLLRLPARILQTEVERGDRVMRYLLRYTQALLTQVSQTAVCNRHHSLDQHLCRWLLLMLDRLDEDRLEMTQEMIAAMLGVRRESVTEAALKLQGAGVISYRRGRIDVVDRPGLERRACECYGVVRAEYRRLLPQPD